jgi:HSP20 family molecular chaperone IbpA
MTALVPRLFGDLSDWFETELPLRTGHMIRVEDFFGDNEYVVRAELPGLDPEKDVQVTVHNGLLTIHAERQEQTQSRTRTEFRYGVLQRTVRLPANADEAKVKAEYRSGILQITVPLTAPEPTGRKVPVTS